MTTWGSRNAEDLYKIAVHLAGFDRVELMREICRVQRGAGDVNIRTVERAMDNLYWQQQNEGKHNDY